MEYSKIISVAGLPGLYELVNTKPDGAIVRSLDDKSTRFASSRIHNFSHLESIEVYTVRENVNLADVFQTMEKAGGLLPDTKDNSAIKKYFEKVYPDIDFERVYNSDLKKMIKWYEVLKSNNIEIKLTEPEPETAVEEETEAVKESKQASPRETKKSDVTKQKTRKKSSGSVSEKTAKKEEAEEKSSRSKSEKPAKKTAKKTKK